MAKLRGVAPVGCCCTAVRVPSAEFMVKKGRTLDRKVYVVPREIDLEIARLKLASMGVAIDVLTSDQSSYLSSWRHGT